MKMCVISTAAGRFNKLQKHVIAGCTWKLCKFVTLSSILSSEDIKSVIAEGNSSTFLGKNHFAVSNYRKVS